MMDWQPIESAPKDDIVLAFCPGHGAVVVEQWYGRWADKQEICDPKRGDFLSGALSANLTRLEPTHWIAIPKPPK